MQFKPLRFVDPDKDRSEFFSVLRKRVDEYFRTNNLSKHYDYTMVIKTIVLLAAYYIPFICLLIFNPSTGISMGLWTIMGFAMAGIGMSVMHDANHGAYSSSSKVNYWVGHSLNLLGGSVYNWKQQHNFLHHTYTNIVHLDDDIDDKLIMRFSPHTEVKWYHKFQPVYAFFFYGIITIYWALLKDFVQFVKYDKEGVTKVSKKEKNMILLKIILSKIFYFTYILVIPLFVLKMPVLTYILGFLLMQFIAGFVLTVIFQLAHTVEETSHPLPDSNYTIENSWAIHQLNTTVNFSPNNKLISWYVGGLNYQVEHHLFPTICHIHYPAISHIVKKTAEEYHVPYLVNDTFGKALKSHVGALVKFGRMPSLNDAMG
ncbi:MAG: acyl-CoA desaturase [Sphingobacteriaceae bacterium]|nr:acyl-CoA desaturase [Sphingobacteriaceae bacterium]